jgi:transposase InsO family protein
MIAFIDDHRKAYGVEPICKVLPIAPSTYHAHIAQRIDVSKRSARAQRDSELKIEVQRVFAENFGVYGVRKVWRQLRREGFTVARCTVERLMASLGLQGAIRGKPVRTTISDKAVPCPLDHVNRQFHALRPNALWVSDFTYVATWAGFVYVAFVIDAYARRIVGWRVSRTTHASFVLDALEQALHDRRPVHRGGLVHHSDRGSQYVSIKYTERLVEAGVEPSVGSVGDSYDNALAETINGLYKAEIIHRRGPWRSLEAVEFATLEWVDWFNNRRLLEPIGNIPPRHPAASCLPLLALGERLHGGLAGWLVAVGGCAVFVVAVGEGPDPRELCVSGQHNPTHDALLAHDVVDLTGTRRRALEQKVGHGGRITLTHCSACWREGLACEVEQ